MATAKKLPSGKWRCRPSYTDEDGVVHTASFTAETAKKANALAAAWQSGMIEERSVPIKITVRQAVEQHIETCRCAGMSPSTLYGYNVCLRNGYGLIADRRLSNLTAADVQRQINERAKSCAPKTIANEVMLLRTAVRPHRPDLDLSHLVLPHQERQEMVIPTDEQVERLVSASANNRNLHLCILFAAFMGLRLSEILALCWEDIDTTAKTLHIEKAAVRDETGSGQVVKSTKTRAGTRVLPIPDALYVRLMSFRDLNKRIVPATNDIISTQYRRLCDSIGIPRRFHNLRHYHASVMLAMGVPEKYIVEDMGHSTFDMVRNVYGHTIQKKQILINQAMATHTECILTGKEIKYNDAENLAR